MGKTIAVFSLTVILLMGVSVPVQAAPHLALTAYDVITAVNALRASYGLDPYRVDSLLMISAQGQADYLASMSPDIVDGHTGPGGTDADARALALGFPYVDGLDINENWGALPESATVDMLIYDIWGDEIHMHTMLHDRGQLVGVGVAASNGQYYYILDVAAYWGDAGLTPQPANSAYAENAASQQVISQYIAPVIIADPQSDGSIIHTVQSGQSLYMLALHYNVDIETIRVLNGLQNSDMIYIGQKIVVRGPTPATATANVTLTPIRIENAPTSRPATPFTAYPIQTQAVEDAALSLDGSLWFLIFFVLFAIGLILVAAGTADH
jgi:LysM repeat protein